MNSEYLVDPGFTMPDSKQSNNVKKRNASRSVYAALNTEDGRIKHLGYRPDLMCKHIVVIQRSLN